MKVIPAYLMKVIPAYLMKVILKVPDEGYSSVPDDGYSRICVVCTLKFNIYVSIDNRNIICYG